MIEFPTIPSDAHYKKDLNDCTAGDLEYLINIRKKLHEITGVEHCAERLDETRHFEIIAKGMRALLALIENDQCCSLKVTTLAPCSG